jgi:gliding motility-associated-like protein
MVKVYWTLIFSTFIIFLSSSVQAQKIYFSDNGTVKRMNLDGTSVQTIVPSGGNYITVDGDGGFLFYNDGAESYRAFLDGTSPSLVTDDGAFAGYNNYCAVPDYESLVYVGISDDMDDLWYGSYYDNPSTPPVRINNGINMGGDEEYFDVTYSKGEEKIYYTGYDNIIYSSNLDGSGAAIVVGSNAHGPLGIDYVNNKIYWVQYASPNYFVMSANLNGSGAATVLSNGNAEITSLDVYPEQNAVFFSETNSIFRITLAGAGKTPLFTGTYIANVAIDFDVTPPAFYALTPTDGASNVYTTTNLSMSFTENLKRSTTSGTSDEMSIRIYETVGNVLVETIDRTSSNIVISGATVTINPATTLSYNKDYYILAGNKVFSDLTDNNWIGITMVSGWNFTTEPDPSLFYSRQNGSWNSPSTWSHVSHAGPPATNVPGTGTDVFIGNGHTVTLTGYTGAVGNSSGVVIEPGGILNASNQEFHVWGILQIDGQLINGGVLSGTFDLYASGGIPVFDQIQYGTGGIPNAPCDIFTNVVALNGISSVNGGTLNTNGFQVCVPPTPPPTTPLFSNMTSSSLTLSWTSGGGTAFVVARQGSTDFKPTFGQPYIANAAFGSGDVVGTGNYVVYSGTGTSVTITGLSPATYYEFDLYSFSTSIGGCYSVQNYQVTNVTSCIVLPAPTGAVNAQYCAGESKPALTVADPGSGKSINWYNAPTGGNLVTGDGSGGSGRGELFIPSAASGTFYAETYDGTLTCSSATRTAVTLTLHPPLAIATALGDQTVCAGGDPTILDGGTASGGTGAYTYLWEDGPDSDGPFSEITGADKTTYDPPAGIAQTTYYRRTTKSATCQQTSASIVVTVNNAPVITAQPTSQQACNGKTATFSITATGASVFYQWKADFGSGFTNITNTGVYSGATTNQLQISNVTGLNNVRFQCEVSSAGSCPLTSTTVPLVVNPNPAVLNQNQAICETVAGTGTGSVDLTALNSALTNGVGGFTVSWFMNAAMTTPVANPSNTTASNNTIFYGRVSSNATGCSSPANVTISVNTKPGGVGNITGPLSMCMNTPGAFTVAGITNSTRYDWQATSGLEITSENGTTASIQGVSGTSGTITVIGENSCGTGVPTTLTVQILAVPEVQINVPAEILEGESAVFSFESASAPFKTISWDLGDNATSTLDAPEHTYAADGNYLVTLTVLDNSNCETTEEVDIVVLSIPELGENDIKNVITANGDTKNGYLYIENIEKYPSNQVVLLDRWGVEVFKQDNYANNWDARKHGDYLPAGQYVCVVKLNETGKIFSRTVSIIKRK